MGKTYNVIVNETFEFSLQANDLENLDIVANGKKANMVYNNKSVDVEVLKADFDQRTYLVLINGNRHQVQVENELDALIEKMGLSLGNTSVGDEINAPMPGLILEVNVNEGDAIKKGDFLCVLEAMKMENTMAAPRDGVIKSINVSKGETVEKGKLLIELEKND